MHVFATILTRTSPNDAAAAEAQGILFLMSAFLDSNRHHQNATLLKPPSENPKTSTFYYL